MTCQNCGNALERGARFCNSCGAPVSTQPSREAVRARAQGGAHSAAAAPGGTLQATLGAQHTPLLCLVAMLLGILQIVYLLVNSIYVTRGAGQTALSVEASSFYGALVQNQHTALAVILVLVTLALMASIAVPMILMGRPKPIVTIGVSLLLLILFIVSIFKIKSGFSASSLGAKAKLGFWCWLFMFNCILIPALVFVSGRMADVLPEEGEEAAPMPSRAAAFASRRNGPSSRPVSPLQKAPRRPGSNGPVRPASPGRNVTPPDAETIAALRRMAQMHKEGLVSDEEFDRIKAECVARGWIREG